MAKAQRPKTTSARRGLLARPLDSLVFLLPLILFYEIVSMTRPSRVIAFVLLQRFFELFGRVGVWAPGLAVVVILLATHVASGQPWRIHWRRVGLMYVEAVALAIPLLTLNWAVPIYAPATLSAAPGTDELLGQVAIGIGAGIYEELVFRLLMISLLVMIGIDFFKLNATWVTIAAVVVGSLAFAAHHHRPIGLDPFALTPFLFRSMAGAYLAVVFWYRGYGPAAGCHAAYNTVLTLINARII